MTDRGDMNSVNALAEDTELPKAGDWIVCPEEHRNWKLLRDIGPGESIAAKDVVSPNGLHPVAGEPVGECSICGASLIVNGNHGLMFRIVRRVGTAGGKT